MGDVIRGPWPADHPGAPMPFAWRSQQPRTEAERHEAALANRPRCTLCEVPFMVNVRVPRDGICRVCRRDIERNTTPDDPALF